MFICSGTVDTLESLLNYLNNNHLNLKFTGHLSSESIAFLDVTLQGKGGRIIFNLYRKPLSGNTILRTDSGHLGHVTHGILVGLHRIYSEEGGFHREKKEMCKRFRLRGYKTGTLQKAISISESIQREDLLSQKKHKGSDIFPSSMRMKYMLRFCPEALELFHMEPLL